MIPLICVVVFLALTPISVYGSVFLSKCASWRAEKYLRYLMKENQNDV